MKHYLTLFGIALALFVCATASCRGGNYLSPSPDDGTDRPSLEQLQQMLDAELVANKIDPEKATAAAPSGADSRVFDLEAALNPGSGQDDPDSAVLTWTGQLPGDYDQNGEVNSADLAPLALNYGAKVTYRTNPPDPEVTWWPAGEVTDTGDAGPGEPPTAGSGAYNWRMARIDGDHNGEINSGDVAVIAQHWLQRASGYRVYSQVPGNEAFDWLADPSNPDSLVTRERPVLGPGMPERYTYVQKLSSAGEFSYFVAPYDVESGLEGKASPVAKVTSAHAPEIQLAAEPMVGNAPLQVDFSLTANSSDAQLVSFAWDFDGDGETDLSGEDLAETSHTYQIGGSYYPKVKVTDSNGKTATATTNIRVDYPPVAVFTMDPSAGVPPLTVTLIASSSTDPGGRIVAYRWDLDGDGEFELDTGKDSAFEWQYTTATDINVGLQVVDNDGYTDVTTRHLLVNTPPVAHFTVRDPEIFQPNCYFDPAGSGDPDGDSFTLKWDFEPDGKIDRETSDTTEAFAHPYPDYGEYRPTLTVTDSHGASSEMYVNIKYMARPVALLAVDRLYGKLPLTVTLDASGSYDRDGQIEYRFDFEGDGDLDTLWSNSPIIHHTYETIDLFRPQVWVRDNDGNEAHSNYFYYPYTGEYYPYIWTSSWNVIDEFAVLASDDLLTSNIDAMQIGDKLAVTYNLRNTGLVVQFSAPNDLTTWDDPQPLPSTGLYCSRPKFYEIDSKPCIAYLQDGILFLLRAQDAAASAWYDPVRISLSTAEYLYDLGTYEGRPFMAYYFLNREADPDAKGIYFVQCEDSQGTSWDEPRLIWENTSDVSLIGPAFFVSSADAEPNVFFDQANPSAACRLYPVDPELQQWSMQTLNEQEDHSSMPYDARNLTFEGNPFACVAEPYVNRFFEFDGNPPDGFTTFDLPWDYGSGDFMYLYGVRMMEGLPHLALQSNQPHFQTETWACVYHYWATDSSLSDWDYEAVCPSYFDLVFMSEFEGQELFFAWRYGSETDIPYLLVPD